MGGKVRAVPYPATPKEALQEGCLKEKRGRITRWYACRERETGERREGEQLGGGFVFLFLFFFYLCLFLFFLFF
jgi:hypothetical protein